METLENKAGRTCFLPLALLSESRKDLWPMEACKSKAVCLTACHCIGNKRTPPRLLRQLAFYALVELESNGGEQQQ